MKSMVFGVIILGMTLLVGGCRGNTGGGAGTPGEQQQAPQGQSAPAEPGQGSTGTSTTPGTMTPGTTSQMSK